MSEPESIITELEQQFPPLSGVAFADARQQAFAAGQCVLIAEEGVIYRVSPDGRREAVKTIEPPTRMKLGSTIPL